MNILLSLVLTLLIIFIVPIVIYGLFAAFFGLKEPDKKPIFFLSVLIQKIGTAIGFVGLFVLAHDNFADAWLTYAAIWFTMFAVVEIGQALMPNYSKKEAVAGIISEAIYFPLTAFAISRLLG